MKNRYRIVPLAVELAAALAGAFILAACGGGSGGAAPAGASSPVAGGTTATTNGTVSGVLSAFGSIVVNGTEYATTASTAVVDGDNDDASSSMSALQVGMTVDVTTSANGQTAERVRFTSVVRGEVDAVDATSGTLTVLGQPVVTTSATSFFGSRTTGSITSVITQLANIQVGDYVSVYGYLECTSSGTGAGGCASTQAVATLVYEPPTASMYRVEGYAQNVDASTGQFTIDGLTVDTVASGTGATACSPTPCALANGQLVAVRSATAPTNAGATLTLTAGSIRTISQLPVLATGTTVSLAGPVSALDTSTDSFDLRGVAVDGSALASTVAGLSDGQIVSVTGTVSAGGTIVATAITVQQYATFSLLGPLTADSATADTLTVLGQTFTVDSATRFADWSQGVRPFNASNFASVLQTGDELIVSGYPTASGDVATRVERIPTPAVITAGAQGVITSDASSADTVTIGGVVGTLGASTTLFYPGAGSSASLSGYFAAITPGTSAGWILGTPGTATGTIVSSSAAVFNPGNPWVTGPH